MTWMLWNSAAWKSDAYFIVLSEEMTHVVYRLLSFLQLFLSLWIMTQYIFSKGYRQITGLCNNQANPTFGQSLTPIRRLLGSASYQDGLFWNLALTYDEINFIAEIQRVSQTCTTKLKPLSNWNDAGVGAIRNLSVTGSPLPSTRVISNNVFQEVSSFLTWDTKRKIKRKIVCWKFTQKPQMK